MKLIVDCGHQTTRGFSSVHLAPGQSGQEFHWCVKCGAVRIQDVRRDFTHSMSHGKFKTIRPKNHYK